MYISSVSLMCRLRFGLSSNLWRKSWSSAASGLTITRGDLLSGSSIILLLPFNLLLFPDVNQYFPELFSLRI
jgi:hypothetical protein